MTPVPAAGLGAGLLARFHRGKVYATDRWQMVRDAFQARDIDPRLQRHGWMADILLERKPAAGYTPVAGGILDLDTVWRHLLRELLDLDCECPDADTLLRWTVKGEGLSRFTALPDQARDAVRARIAAIGGPATAIMACVATGYGSLALPLGLLVQVLFNSARHADPDLATARGRMELYTGGQTVAAAEAGIWAAAAERVMAGLMEADPVAARRWLDRADQLALELRAGAFTEVSRVLVSGFTARLARVADVLSVALKGAAGEVLADLETAVHAVREHAQKRFEPVRCERLFMAVRLVRWLAQPQPAAAGSLSQAARRYAEEGAFVDWARRMLSGGDDLAALSVCYSRLAEQARQRRHAENKHFAGLFRDWMPAPTSLGDGLVPLESVLERVVAPLARVVPVLVLVLDGLSLAVFRELLPRLSGLGWIPLGPAAERRELLGLTPLPTTTKICRTSLLVGCVQRGDQASEKQGFATHSALRAVLRNRPAPILYHKRELTDGDSGMLSNTVRAVVGTADHRIVGIVYNAVDDQLDGAEQIHLDWSVDNLRLLSPLLHEARCAGRVVVLTADHGHVPEDGTAPVSIGCEKGSSADSWQDPGGPGKNAGGASGNGDRWRRAEGGIPGDGEMLVTGPRVMASHGANRVIAVWSEQLRYASRKSGYHGGLSPQEAVVPLAVFAPNDDRIQGWEELPPVEPCWWEGRLEPAPMVRTMAAPSSRARRRSPVTPTLFDLEPSATDWIAVLLAGETYRVQRSLAGGRLPDDSQVRNTLTALAERGGHWTRVALAQRLQVPLFRLGGLLAQMRRLLNVDGYPVLAVDEAAETITFDPALLRQQFTLDV